MSGDTVVDLRTGEAGIGPSCGLRKNPRRLTSKRRGPVPRRTAPDLSATAAPPNGESLGKSAHTTVFETSLVARVLTRRSLNPDPPIGIGLTA